MWASSPSIVIETLSKEESLKNCIRLILGQSDLPAFSHHMAEIGKAMGDEGATLNLLTNFNGSASVAAYDVSAMSTNNLLENFSPEAALAAIERVAPGTKAEKSGNSVFVTGPEGVRVQFNAPARR